MKQSKQRSHFGFIGFGLIGGSIARVLRNLYPKATLLLTIIMKQSPTPAWNLPDRKERFP